MSQTTKIVIIITAALVVLGLAVLAFLSGEGLSFTEMMGAVGTFVGGVLVGILGRRQGAQAVAILAASSALAGCGGAQVDSAACSRAVLDCAEDVITACIPMEGEPAGDPCDAPSPEDPLD